jgi:hypothetical protein
VGTLTRIDATLGERPETDHEHGQPKVGSEAQSRERSMIERAAMFRGR